MDEGCANIAQVSMMACLLIGHYRLHYDLLHWCCRSLPQRQGQGDQDMVVPAEL